MLLLCQLYTQLDNGNLELQLENGMALGDYFCAVWLDEDVASSELVVLDKLCNFPWTWTGVKFDKKFCCRAGLFLFDAC